jgi:hypothetical protein
MRQITIVGGITHREPPMKAVASMLASAVLAMARSSDRICTVARNAPNCCGAWPQMRAKEEQNNPNTPSGSATAGPYARRTPYPTVTAAPVRAKPSGTGMRRRIRATGVADAGQKRGLSEGWKF